MYDYEYLNRLELQYLSAIDEERTETLKALLYGLFIVRDFYSVKKYIEELKISEEYQRYRKALSEIQNAISEVVEKGKFENVTVMHIIDALGDSMVEQIPAIQKVAEEVIRVKGLTVQYAYTAYAFIAMFAGKNVFDVEFSTREINWNDSELLRYLKKESVKFSFSTGYGPLRYAVMKSINSMSYYRRSKMLCWQLFEGLCLLEQTPKDHLIVLHSIGELHYPFSSVGGGKRLTDISQEKVSREDLYYQVNYALSYIDQQIEWYFPYYERTGCLNLIMGDHGISHESIFNMHWGILL